MEEARMNKHRVTAEEIARVLAAAVILAAALIFGWFLGLDLWKRL
jgi:hypothetical protein